jgi:hypothetical protein
MNFPSNWKLSADLKSGEYIRISTENDAIHLKAVKASIV